MSTEPKKTSLDEAIDTYCCLAFWNLVKNSGKSGFAVTPRSELGLKYFCLQSRACAVEVLDKVQDALIGKSASFDSNLILMVQTGIKFCPFCGKSLDEWIAENGDLFEHLATELRPFLSE